MFGHDDSQGNQGTPQNQAADDGTLGVPAPDTEAMPTPATNTDTYMPQEPSLTLPPAAPQRDNDSQILLEGGNGDLINIKQEALQQLKPLVGHLNQTPEERFRTTMMMIQAADDQSLIPEAYEAAKAITDEKAHAQALLDVVNEINYFTAQHA